MKIELDVFGAFRDFVPQGRLELEVANDATIGAVREALAAHASRHWPAFRAGLLASSAFASEHAVLRDADTVPDSGRLAVLPPVSGG